LSAAGRWLLAAGRRRLATPVGVRGVVLDEPAVDEATVALPSHVAPLIEGNQRALESRQTIQRNAREVMVFEVVIGVQEREIPEPVSLHQRSPLRRIVRIDVVMLAEPVQGEGDRKHEEDRNDTGPKRGIETEEIPESDQGSQMGSDRHLALPTDRVLEVGRIGRRLATRRTEIDRKERGRAVQQLVPPLVHLRREVGALRIVFVRPQFSMMIEMPACELAGRDAARYGVEEAEDSLGDGPPTLEHRVMNDFMKQDGEVKNRQPLHQRKRNPDQRIVEPDEGPGRNAKNPELPSCDEEMAERGLLVKLTHLVARDGFAQLSSKGNRVLGVVVRLHSSCFNFSSLSGPAGLVRCEASAERTMRNPVEPCRTS